jgi:hypothetical protein
MRCLIALAGLAGILCAQDKASPFRFVSKDACVVMRVAGPAAWREQFGKTQMLKLLQGPTLAPLLAKFGQGFDAGFAEATKHGGLDAEAILQAIAGYGGEAVFALRVDFATLAKAMADDVPPAVTMVLALQPDGHTDLKSMAEQLQKAIEENSPERLHLHDLKAGQRTLRVGGDEDLQFTCPFETDGQLVVMIGTNLEQQAPAMFELKEHFEAPATATKGPLTLHVELEAGIAAFLDAMTAQMAAHGLPVDPGRVLGMLGLSSLQGFDFALGADGKYTAVDLRIGFNGKDRGLFGIYGSGKLGKPKLMALVPATADHFAVSAFDTSALYRTLAGIWDELGGVVPLSREDAEAAFAEACKVRLKEDLVDNIGGEMLAIQDLKEAAKAAIEDHDEDDPASMMGMVQGSCFCLQLKDGKAFGEAVEKLVRARGLHAGRKTEEYQGVKVHRLRVLGSVEFEYATADDVLLLAFGKGETSHQNLRAVLDQRAALAAGKSAAELAAPVRERLVLLPDGWSALSVTPVTSGIDIVMAMLRELMTKRAGAKAEMEQVVDVLHQVRSELRLLGIDCVVGTNYMDGKSLVARMRW